MQPTLFDAGLATRATHGARRTDPATSHAAAELRPAARIRDRDRVLEMLRAWPDGLTDFELAQCLGGQQTSLGKRRGELVRAGLVRPTGLTRPSPSGARAMVWGAV
jgi:hypothetical protein